MKANGLSEGYIRPIAWRGSEVMGVSAIGTTVHLAIAPWAQEGRLSVQAKPGGIHMTMAQYRRPGPDVAPGQAKVAGLYIICGIEKDRALKAGFDDALMLDWQGRLAESTGANIFLVIGGKLVTPRPENFLDGITRRAVMGIARRRGWSVEERAVWHRYQAAYQDAIAHTATPHAPWYIVPADHKWFARVVIGSAIVTALEKLDLQFTRTDHGELEEYKKVQLALEQEGKDDTRKRAPRKPLISPSICRTIEFMRGPPVATCASMYGSIASITCRRDFGGITSP